MYGLFQNKIRQDIQTKVYHRQHFTLELFGKEYFGLIKTKKIGKFSIQRLQVMGVVFPNDKELIKKELEKIKKKYQKSWGTMFIQFGMVNEIIRFKNLMNKSPEFTEEMRKMRLYIRRFMKKYYKLKTSFKENMPQSTIMINTEKNDEELLKGMKEMAKRHTKKGIKKNVCFRELKETEYDTFYEKWKEVSSLKGFGIIKKDEYLKLVNFLKNNNCGKILITEKDGNIISGSIYLMLKNSLVMLYGFYDRNLGNLGGQQYLKWKSLGRARDHGIPSLDLMGGAPTGFPKHPLIGVSTFKESLGGKKVEFYGNFDLVLNPLLYYIFKLRYKIKH